jgi:hypothetical protein
MDQILSARSNLNDELLAPHHFITSSRSSSARCRELHLFGPIQSLGEVYGPHHNALYVRTSELFGHYGFACAAPLTPFVGGSPSAARIFAMAAS